MIPDPRETPVLPVEVAGRLAGLGRSAAYQAANRWLETDGREGLPCLKWGRSLRCPTALVLDMLGLLDLVGTEQKGER